MGCSAGRGGFLMATRDRVRIRQITGYHAGDRGEIVEMFDDNAVIALAGGCLHTFAHDEYEAIADQPHRYSIHTLALIEGMLLELGESCGTDLTEEHFRLHQTIAADLEVLRDHIRANPR